MMGLTHVRSEPRRGGQREGAKEMFNKKRASFPPPKLTEDNPQIQEAQPPESMINIKDVSASTS